jgi:hypothetical protein
MILIDSQQKDLTTVLGEVEEIFIVNNAILMQIFIKPATSTTTYDFCIKDSTDNIVFEETNCEGEFNQAVSIPVYSNFTLAIDNSSVDEAYKCILSFRRS